MMQGDQGTHFTIVHSQDPFEIHPAVPHTNQLATSITNTLYTAAAVHEALMKDSGERMGKMLYHTV
jgi:hypothetical protein